MEKMIIIPLLILLLFNCREVEADVDYTPLTKEEKRVIINKGTEPPFSGIFNDYKERGLYICKRCNEPLFWSDYKFDSSCGWPSFDDEINDSVEYLADPDGIRTEIVCSNCRAHLGHVFKGEGFTEKNLRHCVNSISINFIPDEKIEKAIFAAGCFWGVQYYFDKMDGVYTTRVGYTGGLTTNPSYHEVSTGTTGHLEAVEVAFNPEEITFEELAILFFEIHDFTQKNGQGPDIGEQYLSVIFYNNEEQKEISERLISILKEKNYDVVTELKEAAQFWQAEDYHQLYYQKKGTLPYCHFHKKIF